MQDLCVNRIEECFVLAEQHYGKTFIRPEIEFSSRMTKTAGMATYSCNSVTRKCSDYKIKLASKLLAMNGMAFVEDTPGHEVAHIICAQLFGHQHRNAHGSDWQRVMSILGQQADRLHTMAVPKVKVKKFHYVDSFGVKKSLTIRKHNALQRGKWEYYKWSDGTIMRKNDWTGEMTIV